MFGSLEFSALAGAVLYHAGLRASRRLCSLLAGYSRLSTKDKTAWDYRLTTNVHALIVFLSAVYLFGYTSAFTGPEGGPVFRRTTLLSNFALALTAGFFLADLLFIGVQHRELWSPELGIHHGIVALASAVAGWGGYAHIYAIASCITEATTPLINNRWFLDKLGLGGSPAYLANAGLIILLWPITRIIPFYYLFSHAWTHRAELLAELPWAVLPLVLLSPGLFFALNILWYYKILKVAFMLFLGSEEEKKRHADDDTPAVFGAQPPVKQE